MAKRDYIESLQKRRLTQVQATAVLGVDQPKVSALRYLHIDFADSSKFCEASRLLSADFASAYAFAIREKV